MKCFLWLSVSKNRNRFINKQILNQNILPVFAVKEWKHFPDWNSCCCWWTAGYGDQRRWYCSAHHITLWRAHLDGSQCCKRRRSLAPERAVSWSEQLWGQQTSPAPSWIQYTYFYAFGLCEQTRKPGVNPHDHEMKLHRASNPSLGSIPGLWCCKAMLPTTPLCHPLAHFKNYWKIKHTGMFPCQPSWGQKYVSNL